MDLQDEILQNDLAHYEILKQKKYLDPFLRLTPSKYIYPINSENEYLVNLEFLGEDIELIGEEHEKVYLDYVNRISEILSRWRLAD